MFAAFESWILNLFAGVAWGIRIYGSHVLFGIAGVLFVAMMVWREVSVPHEGRFGRDPVAKLLFVLLLVVLAGAGLLIAYRIFSNAI